MKIRTIIFLTALITFLSSCKDNEEPEIITIKGDWSLVNVSGTIAGISDDFSEGEIIWTMADGGTLQVENNNLNENKLDILESGTYTYSVLEVNENQYFVLNTVELGLITLTETELTIDNNQLSDGPVFDGIMLTFER